VKELKEYYQSSDPMGDPNGCQTPYITAIGYLDALNTDIPNVRLGYTGSGQISSWILSPADQLDQHNEDALYRSCPAIY
ncbi:MAG: hypothetical protein KAS15_08085, partial [Nanoarchaeota archaeon]|nr:hypothetical protein [Nanoarchaeota archaeon]